MLGLTTETVENGQKMMIDDVDDGQLEWWARSIVDANYNSNHPIVSYIPGDLDSRG